MRLQCIPNSNKEPIHLVSKARVQKFIDMKFWEKSFPESDHLVQTLAGGNEFELA